MILSSPDVNSVLLFCASSTSFRLQPQHHENIHDCNFEGEETRDVRLSLSGHPGRQVFAASTRGDNCALRG